MPTYKKERIREFVDEGLITPLTDISDLLVRCKNDEERALLILLFYTGARPIELSMALAGDVIKEDDSIIVQLRTAKRGKARRLFLPVNEQTEFLYKYASRMNGLLFPHFHKPHRIRDFIYRISDKELCPYFFRHNRMSLLMMKGASAQQVKYFKGAKDLKSVDPYLHLSKHEMEKLRDLL